jgi:hypothetical protein
MKISITETCRCGAGLFGEAEDQVAVGFLRVRHKDWLNEHQSCLAKAEREAYPESTMGRLNLVEIEGMVEGWVRKVLSQPAVRDEMAKAVMEKMGPIWAPAPGVGQWVTTSTTTAVPSGGKVVSTTANPVTYAPAHPTKPPKISPRTQAEMEAMEEKPGIVGEWDRQRASLLKKLMANEKPDPRPEAAVMAEAKRRRKKAS